MMNAGVRNMLHTFVRLFFFGLVLRGGDAVLHERKRLSVRLWWRRYEFLGVLMALWATSAAAAVPPSIERTSDIVARPDTN